MAGTKKSKKIGLFACVLILIGAMFGSAIFSLSGITIYEAGPASIISWVVAAPIMLIYGLITAELAGFFPKSGGVYVFPAKAIKGEKGLFWGWISCWGYILGNIAALSFSAIYVGIYLGAVYEWANDYVVPIAIASLFFVLLLNLINFRNEGIINNILVIALLVFMIEFIIICFSNSAFNIDQLTPFFDQGHSGNFACLSMVPITLISYSAIVAIAFMASDIKDPNKTIPRASIISIIVLAIFYVLIIVATLGLVSADYLMQHPDLQMIPLFAACGKLVDMHWCYYLISISSVLALITTMTVVCSLNSRAIKAAADDRILPKFFGKVNKNKQPFVGAIATIVLAAIITFFPSYVNEIINFGILFNIITIIIVVASLFVARKNFKHKANSYRLKGGKFFPIVFLVAIVLCNISNIITSNLLMVAIYTIVLSIIGLGIFAFSSSNRE